MDAIVVTTIVFIICCVAAALGMSLRRFLADGQLDGGSKDSVRLAMTIVATTAALVMSLLLYTSNSSYNDRRNEIEAIAADVTLLDTVLAQYGADAEDIRAMLRDVVAATVSHIWPSRDDQQSTLGPAAVESGGRDIYAKLLALSPANDSQAILKNEALQLLLSIGRSRQLLVAQTKGHSISIYLLLVVGAWLAILYASFGLFAPRNRVVIGGTALSALSVSGAIFLIVELANPFSGVIRLSSAPIADVLARLGQ